MRKPPHSPRRPAAALLRRTLLAGVVGGLALAGTTVSAQDADAVGYQDGNYGRVRYLDGGLTIVRAADDGDTRAELNSPVFPGDRLVTDYGQRTEIQLAAGTLVRVDMGTSVTFLAMPDPYAEVLDNTVLQLGEGKIRLDAQLTDEEEFRIDTPSASIYLLGDGDYRIEVNGEGRTRMISRRGVAEVVGQGGSVLVRGGTLSDVHPGGLPGDPEPFNTFVSDDFDRWFDEREAAYRPRDRYADGSDAYEALPEEVQPYYGELAGVGTWAYDEDYGYVWSPNHRPSGWRPYRDGYWSYGPGGYFWVSREPWGWAPYHYGRWSWTVNHGWFWSPGRVFAGGWVAWSWGSAYVGWCALDYWNRPAYLHTIHYGYYDPYAWNLIHYDHFHHHYYDHHYVTVHDVGDPLRHSAVVTRPAQASPTALAKNPDLQQQAYKNAQADTTAQLKSMAQNTRPVASFKRQERDLAGKRRVSTGRPAVAPTARPASTDAARFKRELTRGTAARRPAGATTFSVGKSSNSLRPGATSGTRTSTKNPRDMYKRFSTPRTTTRRPAATTTPDGKGPSAKRPTETRKPSRSRSSTPPKKTNKPKGSDKGKQVASVSRDAYPRAGSTSIDDRQRTTSPRARASNSRGSGQPRHYPSRAKSRSAGPRPGGPRTSASVRPKSSYRPSRRPSAPNRSSSRSSTGPSRSKPSSRVAPRSGTKSKPSASRSRGSSQSSKSSSRKGSRSGGKKK